MKKRSMVRGAGPWRFEEELGSGTSGVVYRAVDERGERAAVKVLLHTHLDDDDVRERFRREAQLGIDHPNVVKVLGAGVTDEDVPYIAFELLAGESLEERLVRGPLEPAEAIRIARQACAGLAAAHIRGVVHRDLKPANLFITRDGTLKVLDFGVALATARATRVTQADSIMGTPAYLSPEQTRARRDFDGRTDIWALGAILYEAVSGKAPFSRDSVFATLVAIRQSEPPPLASLVPNLSPALIAVIERALTKDREGRWQSVAEMDAALSTAELAERASAPPTAVSTSDQEGSEPAAETRVLAVLMAADVTDSDGLRHAVERQGGTLVAHFGDRAVGLFGLHTWAGDEVMRAVRAGLDARACAGSMAVTSGQATLAASGIAGGLIDVAERGCRARLAGLAIDAASAENLERRVSLRAAGDGLVEITARRLPTRLLDTPRILGTSKLVGRDPELGRLRSALAAAAQGGLATAVALSGPPGSGKTRLGHEVERLARAWQPMFVCYSARGKSHHQDAALSLMRDIIKSQLRAGDGGGSGGEAFAELPMEARRRAVEELVTEVAGASVAFDVKRCVEALCMLVEVEVATSATLQAARRDPRLMLERLRAGILAYFGAALAAGPIALFVEDLQWVDDVSLDVLAELFERHRDEPLFLLATSREEELPPRATFLAKDVATHLRLGGLASADIARLVHDTIGRRLPDAIVRHLTQHTAGNPLFVEQIVRELDDDDLSAAAAGTLPLPLSVRAAVQSRLDNLDHAEKTLCKQAAIFDRPFYADELETLGLDDVTTPLMVLCTAGFMSNRGRPHPRRGRPHRFQNQLMAEVAYGMLTPQLRTELHRRAAAFLAASAETPAEEVARHYERGGMHEAAARHYHAACLAAVRAGDPRTAVRAADKALALGVAHEARFALLMARADAFNAESRRGEHAAALVAALEAAESEAERGRVLCEQAWWFWRGGLHTPALGAARKAETAARAGRADEVLARALGCRAVVQASTGVHVEASEALVEALALAAPFGPDVRAQAATWRAQLAAARVDLSERRRALEEACELFGEAGDAARAAGAAVALADVGNRFGRYRETAEELRAAIAACRQAHNPLMEGYGWASLAWSLAMLDQREDAFAALEKALSLASDLRDRRLGLTCLVYRLQVVRATAAPIELAEMGEAAAVEAEACGAPSLRATALALTAPAWLALGHRQRALRRANQAMEVRDRLGGLEEDEGLVYLVLADVLEADDQPVASDDARAAGIARIEAIAERIDDPEWREDFRRRIAAHRRLRGEREDA